MTSAVVLSKAWIFEDPETGAVRLSKAAAASQQLPEDPFAYKDSGQAGLVRPLYDLIQLSGMLETNTLHARCVKQKALDVLGRGLELRALADGDPPQASVDAWGGFLDAVEENDDRAEESFGERITMAHQDFESVGWATLEFSRNRQTGLVDGVWHVPGSTVRAHTDGRRFAQMRNGRYVWFKRFGLKGSVNATDGGWSDTGSTPPALAGNEMLVLRNYTPRSDYYGLPDHVPALAAIAGWRAQAEFNVRFFDNQAVPSYAVIVEGADITPELEELIKSHFRAIKGDPHRTIVIPIPAAAGNEALMPKLRFEKLSVDVRDASFRQYKQDNALEICIAHGMPPYRVGWPIVGSLGGSTAVEMTQIYGESVVEPRQELWEGRFKRALIGKLGLNLAGVELKAKRLDTRDMLRDVQISQALFEVGAITPAAIAKFYNLEARNDPDGQLYRDQMVSPPPLPGLGGAGGSGLAPVDAAALEKRWAREVTELGALRKRIGKLAGIPMAAAA
jgi:PBSX family phage portal protein